MTRPLIRVLITSVGGFLSNMVTLMFLWGFAAKLWAETYPDIGQLSGTVVTLSLCTTIIGLFKLGLTTYIWDSFRRTATKVAEKRDRGGNNAPRAKRVSTSCGITISVVLSLMVLLWQVGVLVITAVTAGLRYDPDPNLLGFVHVNLSVLWSAAFLDYYFSISICRFIKYTIKYEILSTRREPNYELARYNDPPTSPEDEPNGTQRNVSAEVHREPMRPLPDPEAKPSKPILKQKPATSSTSSSAPSTSTATPKASTSAQVTSTTAEASTSGIASSNAVPSTSGTVPWRAVSSTSGTPSMSGVSSTSGTVPRRAMPSTSGTASMSGVSSTSGVSSGSLSD